jgi:hypothetical protein
VLGVGACHTQDPIYRSGVRSSYWYHHKHWYNTAGNVRTREQVLVIGDFGLAKKAEARLDTTLSMGGAVLGVLT